MTDIKDTESPMLRTCDGENSSVDPFLAKVVRYVVNNQIGSAAIIRRIFEIGYNRTSRICKQMEELGIVDKQQGIRPVR